MGYAFLSCNHHIQHNISLSPHCVNVSETALAPAGKIRAVAIILLILEVFAITEGIFHYFHDLLFWFPRILGCLYGLSGLCQALWHVTTTRNRFHSEGCVTCDRNLWSKAKAYSSGYKRFRSMQYSWCGQAMDIWNSIGQVGTEGSDRELSWQDGEVDHWTVMDKGGELDCDG